MEEPPSKLKFPCNICNRIVLKDQNAIQCDKCDKMVSQNVKECLSTIYDTPTKVEGEARRPKLAGHNRFRCRGNSSFQVGSIIPSTKCHEQHNEHFSS